MNRNLARLVAGPIAAAGMAAGALGFAAAANADDPVKAAPDLFSAHTGPALADAHLVSEPDRAANPSARTVKLHKLAAAGNHHAG